MRMIKRQRQSGVFAHNTRKRAQQTSAANDTIARFDEAGIDTIENARPVRLAHHSR